MTALHCKDAAYYSGDEFLIDYPNLLQRSPDKAAQLLRSIIANLNENLAALGIVQTRTDLAVQAEFLAGTLPLHQMLDHLSLYAESILLRWPEDHSE
jgi:glutamine synthetase adenylyltransferase